MQQKYHTDIFHYFENGLEKIQILEKNPCDLTAPFRYGSSKMGPNVPFRIFAAKFLCGGSFLQYFFYQKLKPIHSRSDLKYNLFI